MIKAVVNTNVLIRSLIKPRGTVGPIIPRFRRGDDVRGERVIPTQNVKVCRDPDDNMVIETALAGDADYIVTGDDDPLILKRYESVCMVTPRVFLATL